MGIGELFLLAVGLSMDAFAVSVCKGLAMKKATLKAEATCGLWFGGFQALMPVTGFFLGSLFAEAIEAFDHWVAFGLLVIIGINMLKEALEKGDESGDDPEKDADLSVRTMFLMAVATSIDALAVGISLAMVGSVNIWLAAAFIGICTCLLSALGVKIGNVFGSRSIWGFWREAHKAPHDAVYCASALQSGLYLGQFPAPGGSLRTDQRHAEGAAGRRVHPRRSGSLRRRRPAAKVRPFCRIWRVGTAAWVAVRDAGEKAASGVRAGRGRCLHRRDHPGLHPRPQPRHPGRVH